MTLSFAPKRSSYIYIYIYISRPFNFAALIRFVSPESCESVSLFPRLRRWNGLTLRVWENTAQETHNTKLFPWLYYLVKNAFLGYISRELNVRVFMFSMYSWVSFKDHVLEWAGIENTTNAHAQDPQESLASWTNFAKSPFLLSKFEGESNSAMEPLSRTNTLQVKQNSLFLTSTSLIPAIL